MTFQPVETIVSNIVDCATHDEWNSVALETGKALASIRILRDRIDELGGYHDDV